MALAGGFTYRANKKRVEIMRAEASSGRSQVLDGVEVGEMVMPGDIILIKESFF